MLSDGNVLCLVQWQYFVSFILYRPAMILEFYCLMWFVVFDIRLGYFLMNTLRKFIALLNNYRNPLSSQ